MKRIIAAMINTTFMTKMAIRSRASPPYLRCRKSSPRSETYKKSNPKVWMNDTYKVFDRRHGDTPYVRLATASIYEKCKSMSDCDFVFTNGACELNSFLCMPVTEYRKTISGVTLPSSFPSSLRLSLCVFFSLLLVSHALTHL